MATNEQRLAWAAQAESDLAGYVNELKRENESLRVESAKWEQRFERLKAFFKQYAGDWAWDGSWVPHWPHEQRQAELNAILEEGDIHEIYR